jgi:hypothetical protein
MTTHNQQTEQAAKHTAGPWTDSHNGRDDIRVFAESVADSPRCVAKINTPLNRSLEACANARLIAAAPELLNIALRWMEWATGPVVPIAVRMKLQDDTRSALAKAQA